eukprot:7336871-Ditylum_brightwellii.AAC.1
MRLQPAWKAFFKNRPENDALKKIMSSVFKLAEAGLSLKSYVEGFKRNLASCCMTLAPVSGKMFVFHHLTELG